MLNAYCVAIQAAPGFVATGIEQHTNCAIPAHNVEALAKAGHVGDSDSERD